MKHLGNGWGVTGKLKMSKLFAALFIGLAVGWSVVSPAWADDDDYNFSWLDQDKKIYVLQTENTKRPITCFSRE